MWRAPGKNSIAGGRHSGLSAWGYADELGNSDVNMLGDTDSLTGESGASCSWSSLLLYLSQSSSSCCLRGSAVGYELLEDGDNRAMILKGEIGYTVS